MENTLVGEHELARHIRRPPFRQWSASSGGLPPGRAVATASDTAIAPALCLPHSVEPPWGFRLDGNCVCRQGCRKAQHPPRARAAQLPACTDLVRQGGQGEFPPRLVVLTGRGGTVC